MSEQAYGSAGATRNQRDHASVHKRHSQPGGSATGDEDVVEGELRTV